MAAKLSLSRAWDETRDVLHRDGRLIASWGSKTTPDDKQIVDAIEQALKAPRPAAKGG